MGRVDGEYVGCDDGLDVGELFVHKTCVGK